MSLLPPRKRDWQKGQVQIGVFWRAADGTTLEIVANSATPEEQSITRTLIGVMSKGGAAP